MTDSSSKEEMGLADVCLSGGKRTNIRPADVEDWNWWVGYGKGESCQFEGPWEHLALLAARILSHPNTKAVTPDLYREDLLPRREP